MREKGGIWGEEMFDYIRDPAEITKRSFETVRAETDLSGLAPDEAEMALRLVHACGMPDIAKDLVFGTGAVNAGREALIEGRAVLTDVEMVRHGVIRAWLPARNPVLCTLHDPGVKERAQEKGWTRSAAAVDGWQSDLEGAVVAVGNAPTALFRLLELLDGGANPPAVVLGFPVGFVGAAESKDTLVEFAGTHGLPFITLRGRRGGSALAAAAVNALTSGGEARK